MMIEERKVEYLTPRFQVYALLLEGVISVSISDFETIEETWDID